MSGFYRIAAATPVVQLAQPHVNAVRIVELVQEASRLGASAVVFPELSLTGYTCGDLFFRSDLQTAALEGLQTVLHDTATLDLVITVGLPLRIGNALYNVAAVLQKGRLLGLVPKTHLPNYGEYYEKRQFTPAKRLTISEVDLFGGNVPLGNDLPRPHLRRLSRLEARHNARSRRPGADQPSERNMSNTSIAPFANAPTIAEALRFTFGLPFNTTILILVFLSSV